MTTVFVINYFRDEHLAARLLQQLEHFYPEAIELLIPDEPRLKTVLSGEWSQRFLERGLQCDCDTIIKIDPDTCVWRRARIPRADWFGQVDSEGTLIYGGACGFSRTAAQKLVSSGLLLRASPFTYERYGRYKWPHEHFDDTPMSCQDQIVASAMAFLGIKPSGWPDVLNQGRAQIPRPGKRPITHPHPTLPHPEH